MDNIENIRHSYHSGLRDHVNMNGENNPSNKLTEEQVKVIIQKILSGNQLKLLAKEYGVTKATISAIKAKRLWGYLSKDIDFGCDSYYENLLSEYDKSRLKEIITQKKTWKEIEEIFHIGSNAIRYYKQKYKVEGSTTRI